MSDTRDPNNPYDGFGATPPEAFEAPTPSPAPRAYAAPEPLVPGEPVPFMAGEPAPLRPSDSAPLIGAEPVPAMAGALAPEARMGIDAPSLRMGRVVEEMVAWLKTLASAAVYATLIVTFGFQVARVEGQSMAPTLEDQDRLIVNKLAYRLDRPKVGDIVMLYYPLKPEKSFVKRVIAEEGDQVRIVDGKVYRNDVLVDDSFVPAEYRSHDDFGPQVIPEGYYFVMGDHRNNSSDSRHWGNVPEKYIIGKVQLRWWPLPNGRIF
jgi:signal peptidase I